MRVPTDMPKRRRSSGRGRDHHHRRRGARLRADHVAAGLAGFCTDYLWFDSLGLSSVFTGILGAKLALGVIFTGVFFLLPSPTSPSPTAWRRSTGPLGPEDELLNRYHAVVDRRAALVRAVVSLLLGLIAGVGMSSEWNQWLLFTNGGDFGVKDADLPDRRRASTSSSCPSTRASWTGCSPRGVIILLDHGGGPLPQRRHPPAGPGPAGHPPGEGPRVGAARPSGPGEGGRLLAAALRAHLLHQGRGRRCHLHRRQRPAPGDLPAAVHRPAVLRAVHLQHLAAGLGSPGRGRGPVGAGVGGGRRGLPRLHPAVPGASPRSRARRAPYIAAQHRGHAARRSASTTSRLRPSTTPRTPRPRPTPSTRTRAPSATSGCSTRRS